jgi:hypothetical protein
MRRLTSFAVAVIVAAGVLACNDAATAPDPGVTADRHLAGNGFPKGGHDYRLNIIGVDKNKTADMDDNNGRRIFVQLYCDPETAKNCNWDGNKEEEDIDWRTFDKTNLILLRMGDFQVTDSNATDDDGAMFYLPAPGTFSIYARAHGKPGGSTVLSTCGFDDGLVQDENGDIWCSIDPLIIGSSDFKGKNHSKAIPVTEHLTQIAISTDAFIGADEDDLALQACLAANQIGGTGDGDYDLLIFSSCFEDYFWSYNNNGLRLLELRFYMNE